MASPRRDVYQEITNKIIAMQEEGKRPWLQPWQDGEGVASFPIRSTGEPYRGINVLLLWSEAADKGYNSPYWFTYKQAAALKAHVRKGETGTTIVYAGSIQRTDTDEATGEDSATDTNAGECPYARFISSHIERFVRFGDRAPSDRKCERGGWRGKKRTCRQCCGW
ncbi:ArdC family protein [Ochrobactrum sp. BTU2]|uniref:ArdC-like ssDNA-binding domain-containing protein n=1 Tax=Ochrobactrum sp. BTU2 TaxID=2856166 RepID=UPI002119EEE3|nr:ArdC family protein [Ochrobactrum sp. BTU2]MCQ9147613.1 ArdC family protein [Ochrobactrum sp. BTU2]